MLDHVSDHTFLRLAIDDDGLFFPHTEDEDFTLIEETTAASSEVITPSPPPSPSPAMNDNYSEYNERDVLLGRGGGVNKHSGNRVYRRLVEAQKPLYKALANKEEKALLVRSILIAFKEQGARFLKKQRGGSNTWYQVSDSEAMTKISQAMREQQTSSCSNSSSSSSASSSPVSLNQKFVSTQRNTTPHHFAHMMISTSTANTTNVPVCVEEPGPLLKGISQLFGDLSEPTTTTNHQAACEVVPIDVAMSTTEQDDASHQYYHHHHRQQAAAAAPQRSVAAHNNNNLDVAAFMKSNAPKTITEYDDDDDGEENVQEEGGLLGNSTRSSASQLQQQQFMSYIQSAAAAGFLEPLKKQQGVDSFSESDQREFVRLMRDASKPFTGTYATAPEDDMTAPVPLDEAAPSMDVMQLLRCFTTGMVVDPYAFASNSSSNDNISNDRASI